MEKKRIDLSQEPDSFYKRALALQYAIEDFVEMFMAKIREIWTAIKLYMSEIEERMDQIKPPRYQWEWTKEQHKRHVRSTFKVREIIKYKQMQRRQFHKIRK